MGSHVMRTELWGEYAGAQVAQNPETLDAIRRQVERLPALDRSLLALHYAGELSPKEIADGMSMPTRTVTSRIRAAMDTVRCKLVEDGVSLPNNAVTPEHLVAAICTGVPVPDGLREKVLDAVARLERNTRRSVSPYDEPISRSWGEIATALIMIVSAVAAIWWFAHYGV